MSEPASALFICSPSLARFGDGICVRDARGRSGKPSLRLELGLWPETGLRPEPGLRRRAAPESGRSSSRLRISGPFTVIQKYAVEPDEGRLFTDACRDENSIHRESDVVPGAMTAARAILLPELLLPGCAVESLRFRFRAIARYHRSVFHHYRFLPADGGDGLQVWVSAWQNGVPIADGRLKLSPAARVSGPEETSRAEARPAEPSLLLDFYRSLRVRAGGASAAGFSRRDYPRAFLAALPSGEMVRKFSRDGGLLNILELDFTGGAPAALGDAPPVAQVEKTSTTRRSFTKVLTQVLSGLTTIARGFALVFPGGNRDAGGYNLAAAGSGPGG